MVGPICLPAETGRQGKTVGGDRQHDAGASANLIERQNGENPCLRRTGAGDGCRYREDAGLCRMVEDEGWDIRGSSEVYGPLSAVLHAEHCLPGCHANGQGEN